MTITEKAKESLNRLLQMFEIGDLPQAVARTVIADKTGHAVKPSDKWSLGNWLLMIVAGTGDARGFNQWQEVGRHVKKGAKAILYPCPLDQKEAGEAHGDQPGNGRDSGDRGRAHGNNRL